MTNSFEKTTWVAELEVVCELTRKLNAELTLLQIMAMPMVKQPEVTYDPRPFLKSGGVHQ